MGAGWFKSAFEYNNTGVISKNEAGISFLLGGLFAFPFKYITLEQNNVIAVFFTDKNASPFYTGTIRMNVKPYFKWMNLYFQIGIKTFFYNTFENDIKTAMFVWGIGTSFDINFPDVTKKIKRQKIDPEKLIDNKKSDVTNDITTKKIEIYPDENDFKETQKNDNNIIEEKKENNISENKKEKTKYEILKETIINKYENSKIGTVNLEYISFSKNNDVLDKESFTILDSLAEILKLEKDFTIAIGGYSIFFDNPTLEIEYAKEKALVIKRYLEKKGVAKEKIKIMASGRVYSKNELEKNRKIEIKILKK